MATSRSATVYADFLLPHLEPAALLVDVGCGSGELSLELAPYVRRLTGVDVDADDIGAAARRAQESGVANVDFVHGEAYAMTLDDDHADAVLAHSVLEALDRPADALTEMKRVLVPGGVIAVASVEYGGLILAGPHHELTRRFYDIRERLWQLDGADPFRGRHLRGLLVEAGFVDVVATTTSISYGTAEAVREFGIGRADDCTDDWYVDASQRHGLATADDLTAMQRAWLEWSDSASSYAAFAWCRALGWKPLQGAA